MSFILYYFLRLDVPRDFYYFSDIRGMGGLYPQRLSVFTCIFYGTLHHVWEIWLMNLFLVVD